MSETDRSIRLVLIALAAVVGILVLPSLLETPELLTLRANAARFFVSLALLVHIGLIAVGVSRAGRMALCAGAPAHAVGMSVTTTILVIGLAARPLLGAILLSTSATVVLILHRPRIGLAAVVTTSVTSAAVGSYVAGIPFLWHALPAIGLPGCILGVFYHRLRRVVSRQQDQMSQARHAAAEFAGANIRLQESVLFSQTAVERRERSRIAQHLHDSVGHTLTAVLVQLRNWRVIAAGADSERAEQITALEEMVQGAIQDIRAESHRLELGARQALAWPIRWRKMAVIFSKCTGVRVRLTVAEDLWQIADDVGEVLFGVIQEGLNNAVRHGNASEVDIVIRKSQSGGLLLVRLSDNGAGAQRVGEGMGIRGMRRRVAEIGGSCDFATLPDKGFDIGVDIPIERVGGGRP